jgi:predicted permease
MDTLVQDLRFAVRMLLKSPGFTLIAVLCTALGIGSNTAIFSVVNAILLRPFPYADPERIVAVNATQLKGGITQGDLSYLDYQDLQKQSSTLAQVAAYTGRSLTFSDSEEPERVSGEAISAELFPMLGVKPVLGQNFRPEDDRPGADGAILLSHDLWLRRFEGDPAIVGKTVIVNSLGYTVAGVMPPGFGFPERQAAWIPLAPLMTKATRLSHEVDVLARLKPGATLEQAQTEAATIAERLAREHADSNAGWSFAVRTLRDEFANGDMELVLLTMMGAVVFVLLIACANVANLLLARATSRQREMAVRAAIGAGRGRIVRQLLTESVLVGLLGGALGVVFGYWGIRWIYASIPADNQTPYWMVFSIDSTVLLYTLGVAVVTGLLFGLAPALQAAKTDLNETLKDGARGAGGGARNGLRSGLVVLEVALSLVLLVGASLFVRSFLKLQNADPGFSTENLIALRTFLPGDRYEDDAVKTRRVEDLARRVAALPGVEQVVVSNFVPAGRGGSDGPVVIDGLPVKPGEEASVFFAGVTSKLLPTLGLSVLAGRDLTEREALTMSGYALVTPAFAKKFWPGEAPARVLGRRIQMKERPEAGWLTVVGLAPDIKVYGVDEKDPVPSVFVPYPYDPARNNGLTIRTTGDPGQVIAAVRREIRASDAELPVFEVASLEQMRQDDFWEYRMFGGMFTVFGAIALFLASIGVYGVLSYSVSQRWREIGIRVALGAHRADILRLVVGQGLRLACFGIGFGLAGAFLVTRVISSLLFDVSPTDPVSFGLVSALLAGVAMYASYLPASRAVGVDPLSALRAD